MTSYRVYFNRSAVNDVPENVVVPGVAQVCVNEPATLVLFTDEDKKVVAVYPVSVILGVERIREG